MCQLLKGTTMKLIHTERSEDGEMYTSYYVMPLGVNIKENLPSTHCQHDYDCCGNYYQSSAEIIHEDSTHNIQIAAQRSYLNV